VAGVEAEGWRWSKWKEKKGKKEEDNGAGESKWSRGGGGCCVQMESLK